MDKSTPQLRSMPHPPDKGTDQGAQIIEGDDYQRLWRIAYAVQLLAALPNEAAKVLGINADHTQAISEYIAEDLNGILSRSKPADE